MVGRESTHSAPPSSDTWATNGRVLPEFPSGDVILSR